MIAECDHDYRRLGDELHWEKGDPGNWAHWGERKPLCKKDYHLVFCKKCLYVPPPFNVRICGPFSGETE
jgi:hypothetical protein